VSSRDRILEVALERFAHQGISATTIQDIADHASASKANVLYHFGNKEHLVDLALQPALDALSALIAALPADGLRDREARVGFLHGFVDFLVSHRLAAHVVIAHPYLTDQIASLATAQRLMLQLAEVVSQSSSGEFDRLRFGVAVSGASYALVSAGMLGIGRLSDEQLRPVLTEVLLSMSVEQGQPQEVSS
jgi:TetR/AcrR family transcriptional regulator